MRQLKWHEIGWMTTSQNKYQRKEYMPSTLNLSISAGKTTLDEFFSTQIGININKKACLILLISSSAHLIQGRIIEALCPSLTSTVFYCNSSKLPAEMLKKQSQFWNISKLYIFSLVTNYVTWHFGFEYLVWGFFDGGFWHEDTCLSQVTICFPFEMLWYWKMGYRFKEGNMLLWSSQCFSQGSHWTEFIIRQKSARQVLEIKVVGLNWG